MAKGKGICSECGQNIDARGWTKHNHDKHQDKANFLEQTPQSTARDGTPPGSAPMGISTRIPPSNLGVILAQTYQDQFWFYQLQDLRDSLDHGGSHRGAGVLEDRVERLEHIARALLDSFEQLEASYREHMAVWHGWRLPEVRIPLSTRV